MESEELEKRFLSAHERGEFVFIFQNATARDRTFHNEHKEEALRHSEEHDDGKDIEIGSHRPPSKVTSRKIVRAAGLVGARYYNNGSCDKGI